MPLVMLSGFPSSGKTTLGAKIAQGLQDAGLTVEVISDHALGFDPRDACSDANTEKSARATLKSAVERTLSRTVVVVVDGLNYIKGYRYELYCIARSLSTPSCVVHVATSDATSARWNAGRDRPYTDELLDALFRRFECPDARSRWDAPLFTVGEGDPVPIEGVLAALSSKNAKAPNKATSNLPLAATNSLHDVERISQQVISALLKAQTTAVPGDLVPIPDTAEKVKLRKVFTMVELRRIRRQFTTYTKTHPIEDGGSVATMFVQFLNSQTTS